MNAVYFVAIYCDAFRNNKTSETMLILNELSDSQIPQLIKDGCVGVLPTDTIYGLVCSAHSKEAVERLYTLKPRELKPGTVVAANVEQLATLGIDKKYLDRVAHLWPNPISIVLPNGEGIGYLDQGLLSIPVRIPRRPELTELLLQTGPLLTTSANDPDCPPSTNMSEAQAYFGEKVDFYVDGGDLSGRPPSTIIKLIEEKIQVIRQGAVIIIDEYGQLI